MEQKDYLMREIEKLAQFLMGMIRRINGLNVDNFEVEMNKINEDLVAQFDLTLNGFIRIDKSELIEKLKNIDTNNLELLTKLLSEIIYKIDKLEKRNSYDIYQLAKKVIVLIEYLNTETQIFSMERMQLKSKLQKRILNDEEL